MARATKLRALALAKPKWRFRLQGIELKVNILHPGRGS